MRFRRDGDDARGRRGPETVEQEIGEQERRQMVDARVSSNPSDDSRRRGENRPALLTSTSRWSTADKTWSASRRTSARREKSASRISTLSEPVCAVTNWRAVSVRAGCRPAMITRMPARARPSAVWRPMPELAPVTRATRRSDTATLTRLASLAVAAEDAVGFQNGHAFAAVEGKKGLAAIGRRARQYAAR